MLLRSSSTPILNSWIPHSKDQQHSPEPDSFPQIPRTSSLTLSSSSLISSPSFSSHGDYVGKMTRALSETDLRSLSSASVPKRNPRTIGLMNGLSVAETDEVEEETASFDCGFVWGSNGLGEKSGSECSLSTLVAGDGAGGCGGRTGTGGGGSEESWDSNDYKTEAYYETMIEANPGNSLLLGNYARFLKDVRGNLVKAEEYCGRAILVNPNDGDVLSMYADLIWRSHKDSSRAESYFDRAVKAAPDDS
ncbi:hypothetical protein LINGRAHAP2_LOCUS20711 [Linum grandiflorum]